MQTSIVKPQASVSRKVAAQAQSEKINRRATFGLVATTLTAAVLSIASSSQAIMVPEVDGRYRTVTPEKKNKLLEEAIAEIKKKEAED